MLLLLLLLVPTSGGLVVAVLCCRCCLLPKQSPMLFVSLAAVFELLPFLLLCRCLVSAVADAVVAVADAVMLAILFSHLARLPEYYIQAR